MNLGEFEILTETLGASATWRFETARAPFPEYAAPDGRHDYGTRILKRTGNLAAVMRTMGHKDVKTAMQYQHPELEIVRAALDQDSAVEKRA